jgi:hypothetical protein
MGSCPFEWSRPPAGWGLSMGSGFVALEWLWMRSLRQVAGWQHCAGQGQGSRLVEGPRRSTGSRITAFHRPGDLSIRPASRIPAFESPRDRNIQFTSGSGTRRPARTQRRASMGSGIWSAAGTPYFAQARDHTTRVAAGSQHSTGKGNTTFDWQRHHSSWQGAGSRRSTSTSLGIRHSTCRPNPENAQTGSHSSQLAGGSQHSTRRGSPELLHRSHYNLIEHLRWMIWGLHCLNDLVIGIVHVQLNSEGVWLSGLVLGSHALYIINSGYFRLNNVDEWFCACILWGV